MDGVNALEQLVNKKRRQITNYVAFSFKEAYKHFRDQIEQTELRVRDGRTFSQIQILFFLFLVTFIQENGEKLNMISKCDMPITMVISIGITRKKIFRYPNLPFWIKER